MKILFSILFGYILAHLYEKVAIVMSRGKPLVVLGYRLHHSLYGIIFLGLGYLYQQQVLYGIAVGIILQHTITDGFRFISKEK